MRIRTVKEGFWQSETLASIPKDSRLLAIALLNYADDKGFFFDVPQVIRGALFPFDEDSSSIRRGLDDLSHIGYIRRGVAPDGKRVAHIVNFLAHQRIDRPQPSKIAGLEVVWDQFDEDSTNARRVFAVGMEEEGNGVGEGEGKHPLSPPNESSSNSGRIPASDWSPLQEHRDIAAFRNADIDAQLSRFRERNAGQTDTDQGWSVRFRQWLGSARPERRDHVASDAPTMEEWIAFARTINNHGALGKWPKESAEAGWLENQAKGWRYVSDWQADCQARAKRWAANEATQAQRRKA